MSMETKWKSIAVWMNGDITSEVHVEESLARRTASRLMEYQNVKTVSVEPVEEEND